MRILLLGCGAVGRVAARHMTAAEEIDHVIAADVDKNAALETAEASRDRRVEPVQLDAFNRSAVRLQLKRVDLVINAAHARFDLPLMEQCLDLGVQYADLSSLPEQQLLQDERWKEVGLTAFLGAGEDPGIGNVLARYAADGMDRLDSVRIRDGDVARAKGFPLAAVWSPVTFIKEVLSPAIYYRDGRIVTVPPLSGRELYRFPRPLGPQPVYWMEHEEPVTLPRFLGKGLRYVDLKLAVDDNTVRTLQTLEKLGLTSDRRVEFGGARFTPIDFVASRLPRASFWAGKVDGHAVLVIEVRGRRRGKRLRKTLWMGLGNREAWRRFGATATAYLVGTGCGIVATLFARGMIRQWGVISAECLDPQPFLALLREKGLSVHERRGA